MAWFKKQKAPIGPIRDRTVRTEGLWQKCEQCKQTLWKKDLEPTFHVCPQCDFHFRVSAGQRLARFFDEGRYKEYDRALASDDPLQFVAKKAYRQRLSDMQAASGMKDALLAAEGKVGGKTVCVCAMEPSFISGSMGVVVGEKITRAIERCLEKRHPLIIISCSGGARMQEGALSLMQMAKITAALERLEEGTYGYCYECGEEIAGRRLRALPFAERCRDCEETHELELNRERMIEMRSKAVSLFGAPSR